MATICARNEKSKCFIEKSSSLLLLFLKIAFVSFYLLISLGLFKKSSKTLTFKKKIQILRLEIAQKNMCIKWCPQQCRVTALDFISFQSQVDMFLINEAFVPHHKTSEEYPSNATELCPTVNYHVTFDHALVLGLEGPISSLKKV